MNTRAITITEALTTLLRALPGACQASIALEYDYVRGRAQPTLRVTATSDHEAHALAHALGMPSPRLVPDAGVRWLISADTTDELRVVVGGPFHRDDTAIDGEALTAAITQVATAAEVSEAAPQDPPQAASDPADPGRSRV